MRCDGIVLVRYSPVIHRMHGPQTPSQDNSVALCTTSYHFRTYVSCAEFVMLCVGGADGLSANVSKLSPRLQMPADMETTILFNYPNDQLVAHSKF